jgi:hypothetical protein
VRVALWPVASAHHPGGVGGGASLVAVERVGGLRVKCLV